MSKNIDEKSMINKYINEVQSALPFSCPGRRKFIINIKEELEIIYNENIINNYEELCSYIGSPITLCDTYMQNISKNKWKKYKRILYFIILLVIIALISAIIYFNMHPYKDKDNVWHLKRVITIESEEVVE